MTRKAKETAPRFYQDVKCDVGGRTYQGRYYIEDDEIFVIGPMRRTEKARLSQGSDDPKGLAQMMLRTIVNKALESGWTADADG